MTARPPLAYLIQCHDSARYVAYLLSCLYSPFDVYLIHADAKSPTSLRNLVSSLDAEYPNVHALPSELISWGGFSQAAIVLRAVERLQNIEPDWTHLVVLSEQHLPLTSSDQIARALVPGQSWVPYTRFKDMPANGKLDVRHRFGMHYRELPGVGPFAEARSTIDESFYDTLFHSNNWFVLARAACERLDELATLAEVVDPFVGSLQPDELLVPTLLLGYSPGGNLDIRRKNASFLALPHLGGARGLIFTEGNFHRAVDEGYLFIRKRPSDLPESVERHLAERRGASDAMYRELEARARSGDAVSMAAHPNQVTDRLAAILGDRSGMKIEDFTRTGFHNIPKVYTCLRAESWHPDVKIAVLSEDFASFKIALVWDDHCRDSFEPSNVGGVHTSVIKARVHGLSRLREVFVDDYHSGGFLDTAPPADLACLEAAIVERMRHAETFSRVLQAAQGA